MRLRVLIVEDSGDDALLLEAALRRGGYELTTRRVDDAPAMREALREEAWDVVCSDHDMPGFDAPGALRVLKESGLDLPFLIVSGNIGEELAVEALKQGADDYILKHNLRRLAPAVQRSLVEAANRRQLRRRQVLDQLRAAPAAGTGLEGRLREMVEAVRRETGSRMAFLVREGEGGAWAVEWAPGEAAEAVEWSGLLGEEEVRVVEGRAECPEGWPGWQRAVVTPLRSGRVVHGALGVVDKVEGYTAEDVEIAGQFGALALEALERQQAAEELKQSEARFRDVVENAPEGIFIQSGGRFQYLNPSAVRMFGASSAEQLLGLEVLSRLSEESRAAAAERIRRLNVDRLAQPSREMRFVKLDGTELVAEVSAVPFLHEGQPGALVFVHDLSERRAAESRREALEAQLQQAQKLESIGRLAGGIAHDFNNLLTVINGYSDLLKRELREGDPLRGQIEEIRKAGGRAAELTKQLLTFSRKQVVEVKPEDVTKLVVGMREMLKRLLGEEVELEEELEEAPGLVLADSGQLHQVLLNLCVNARDAMPQGGRLRLETARVEVGPEASQRLGVKEGGYVRLRVADTGTGISEEVRKRMFDPFFTTKAEGEGTGLGLSMVYGIVTQAGGAIEVKSEVGQGTRFEVYLPVAVPARAEIAEPAVEEGALRGRETILLVEDQEEVRRLTSEMLKARGYRVLEAANGGEALLEAERHEGPIELMVTDVVMPRMTGRELADRLSAVRPEMKVLFVSGYTADVVLQRGVAEEGVAFLAKPFTEEVLARRLREMLGPEKRRQRVVVVEQDEWLAGLYGQMLRAGGHWVKVCGAGEEARREMRVWRAQAMVVDLDAGGGEALELVERVKREGSEARIVVVSGGRGMAASAALQGVVRLRKPLVAGELLAALG